MKQKYALFRNDRDQELIIKEFAELDKNLMSLMCEETYSFEMIEAAIAGGQESLIKSLRTRNLYPPSIYSDKIAASVTELFRDRETETRELFFDDVELLTRERQSAETEAESPDDSDDLDDVLENDNDLPYEDTEQIGKLNSSIKIEDDQYITDADGDR